MQHSPSDLEKAKVNLETSQIAWRELQRFFAAGQTIAVAADLDLIEVAYQFSADNRTLVAAWLQQGVVGPVSDRQASAWYQDDSPVWAVVVKPWILVQASAQPAD